MTTDTAQISAENVTGGPIDVENRHDSMVRVDQLQTLDGGNIRFLQSGNGDVEFDTVGSAADADPSDGESDIQLRSQGSSFTFAGPVSTNGTGNVQVDSQSGITAFTADGSVTADVGMIRIESSDLQLDGSLAGAGELQLRTHDAQQSIGIGDAAGEYTLDSAELSRLADGFANITIGREEDGAGQLAAENVSVTDNLHLVSGEVVAEAVSVADNQLELTARTGKVIGDEDGTTDATGQRVSLSAATGIGDPGKCSRAASPENSDSPEKPGAAVFRPGSV